MPDRRPADRIGYVAADHGGAGGGRPVGRLRRRGYQGLQKAVVLQADHVDQEPGSSRGKRTWIRPGASGPIITIRRPWPGPRRRAGGWPFPLDDRPGHPADPAQIRSRRTAGRCADDRVIALPEGRGGDRPPARPRGGQRKALLAPLGKEHENMRADVKDPAGNRVHQRSFRDSCVVHRHRWCEGSDSSRRPRTAALSSDLRANRAGPAESVTSSHQRGMSAKCRTCPPWDCIGHE